MGAFCASYMVATMTLHEGNSSLQEVMDNFTHEWNEARRTDPHCFNHMFLATCSDTSQPSVRLVTLQTIHERGLVFFTNSESHKGRDLARNPAAAAAFYWPNSAVQIKIRGKVDTLDESLAEQWWSNRLRENQLVAHASNQSRKLGSAEELREHYQQAKDKYRDRLVPKPTSWKGYLLIPEYMETWKSGWHNNVHPGVYYSLEENGWTCGLLNP